MQARDKFLRFEMIYPKTAGVRKLLGIQSRHSQKIEMNFRFLLACDYRGRFLLCEREG